MTLGPEIEPGTHWWKATALTTMPPPRGVSHMKQTGMLIGNFEFNP